MTAIWDSILLISSIALALCFFLYSFDFYYMMKLSGNYRPPSVGERKEKPTVAIHLPIYNEKYVAERLLGACIASAELFGEERVRVQVLDDSTDETTAILEKAASSYRSRGFNVIVRHRDVRTGFKAGALREALEETREEFVVVFDSDFVPKPDFLVRAVAFITADEKLGVVQFRWSYTNRDYNWITKSVAIGLDAHFLIEQPARSSSGLFLKFNGSAGIIRTSALKEAGGWQEDTLAEDLDSSYRIQMCGYRIQYVMDDVPCEIPPTVAGFKRQQARWTRGSLQVAKKSLGQIIASKKFSKSKKFDAFVHLTYYMVHPLMYASFLITCFAAVSDVGTSAIQSSLGSNAGFASVSLNEVLWLFLTALVIVCTVGGWAFYIKPMRMQGISVARNFSSLLFLGLLGYGICVSNTLEAFKGLFLRKTGVFKRTPKYAVVGKSGSWKDKKYQIPIDSVSAFELGSFMLALLAIWRSIVFANYGVAAILCVFAFAFLLVFVTTLFQRGKEERVVPGLSKEEDASFATA